MISQLGAYYAMAGASSVAYPLDHVASDVRAAISLRQLLSAYSGPLCRISSSNTGTPYVDVYPDPATGFADNATIVGLVPSGTVYLTVMYDQSGGGHDFTPPSGAHRSSRSERAGSRAWGRTAAIPCAARRRA